MTDVETELHRHLLTLNKDQSVVDLACGRGWAGRICLDAGFKSVEFADARPERIVVPIDNYPNCRVSAVNIESDQFADYIKNFDVIVYFGHLYHSINPSKIIEDLAQSNCKHLFLESKTLGMADVHEFGPARIVNAHEPSSEEEAAFSENDEMIKICRPSLNWARQALVDNGFTIKAWYTGKLINKRMPPGSQVFGRYLIYATKS